MMDQKPFIPFRPASIVQVTHGHSFSLTTSRFHQLQTALISSTSYKTYNTTVAPIRNILLRSFNNVVTALTGLLQITLFPSLPYIDATYVTALWTVILACMLNKEMKNNNGIENETEEKSGDLLRRVSSTLQDVSTGISEWWASTSDDSPLFDDDYDFDDDIIGMEISFVTVANDDDDMSLSNDDDDEMLEA